MTKVVNALIAAPAAVLETYLLKAILGGPSRCGVGRSRLTL
jgi:hypothetical protein